MNPVELEHSRTFPATVAEAFGIVLPAPLAQVFARRYGALPPVRAVRGQEGEWGTVGQTRVILLADGGSMREELLSVVPGQEFGYRITDVTGPMKALVTSLDGRWRFTPAGTGVRISWAWTVHPANALGRLSMPLFGRLWRGYARQAMEEIETLLVEGRQA